MTNSSPWGFVLRWQLAGMFVTLAALAALIVVDAVLRDGLSLLSAVRVTPIRMVWISAFVLMITPLSLVTLWGFAVHVVGERLLMMRV